jgi:hypothetical protein
VRKAIAALAVLFFAAHAPFLPPTLEDVDSINFALGVQQFDVAHHQPHPPGYPVFIALGKVSTAVFRRVGVPSPETRALAVWSAVSGTVLVWFLFTLYLSLWRDVATGADPPSVVRQHDQDERRAAWTTLIAVTAPLFWFTSLRPLSDMTGLAGAVAAQALILSVLSLRAGPTALISAGLIAGVSIGIRSQTFLLTMPLLGLALAAPGLGLRWRDRAAVLAATLVGVLVWAVPLVVASGGLGAYAAALGSQAGEDFSGVVMLWNVRTPRVAIDALTQSFLWPWGSLLIGAGVAIVAAAGAVRLAWQHPRVLFLLALGFGPYAVFHLLFHEAVTVRYALPLVIPVAYLVASALESRTRLILPVFAVALASVSLVSSVSASVAYARDGSPAFRAFRELERWPRGSDKADADPSGGVDAVGMHAVDRRVAEWERSSLPGRPLYAPHGREWLALVEEWRARPASVVAFVADPRRTDLALIDRGARRLVQSYRWSFVEPPFVGGARPGNSDLYRMSAPRWMLDRGWALGAEIAGVTARDHLGPHRQPSVAWVRSANDSMLLMIGGRHLGAAGDPKAHVTLRVGGQALGGFDVEPGFFFDVIPVPANTFAGVDPYVPLQVTSDTGSAHREIPVALEQFDLQPNGIPMVGLSDGWYEPEYNPAIARAWRWAADRSTLWVRPIGRDVTLVLEGESPLRYFPSAPQVTVTLSGHEVGRFSPAADFQQRIVLPAGALTAAQGRVVMQSDRSFVPGERDRTGDRRRLALRIYSYSVE